MEKKKNTFVSKSGIFRGRSIKILTISAIFVSLSIILGKYLSITTGAFRISFENLTIILAGYIFGPIIGLVVGLCSDFIGCILYPYQINPYILVAAGLNGLVSGLISKVIIKKPLVLNFKYRIDIKLILSVFFSHAIGSILIKSYGLYKWYYADKTYLFVLFQRLPVYAIIAVAEYLIINTLLNNKEIRRYISELTNKSI